MPKIRIPFGWEVRYVDVDDGQTLVYLGRKDGPDRIEIRAYPEDLNYEIQRRTAIWGEMNI